MQKPQNPRRLKMGKSTAKKAEKDNSLKKRKGTAKTYGNMSSCRLLGGFCTQNSSPPKQTIWDSAHFNREVKTEPMLFPLDNIWLEQENWLIGSYACLDFSRPSGYLILLTSRSQSSIHVGLRRSLMRSCFPVPLIFADIWRRVINNIFLVWFRFGLFTPKSEAFH